MRARVLIAVALTVATIPSAAGQSPPPKPVTCLIFDLDNDGVRLTPPADGVSFDLDADGRPERVGWTTAGAWDAFLALDVNGNGRIDNGSELIGNAFRNAVVTEPASGITVMSLLGGARLTPDRQNLDRPPGDPHLEPSDAVFAKLVLWSDLNHDGASEPSELRSLQAAGVKRILTGAEILNHPDMGNTIRYKSAWTRTVDDLVRTFLEVALARASGRP